MKLNAAMTAISAPSRTAEDRLLTVRAATRLQRYRPRQACTVAGLSGTNGWWNSVEAVDLRGNGRQDLVLGNLGLNSYLRASPKEPARLYVNDFSHSGGGNLEQILTFYKNGVSYPAAGRDELVKRIPSLRSKYPSYKDFGASRIEDIFP